MLGKKEKICKNNPNIKIEIDTNIPKSNIPKEFRKNQKNNTLINPKNNQVIESTFQNFK